MQASLVQRTSARLKASLRQLAQRPPVHRVDFGDLRRLRPISRKWGFDRGLPIDRAYIDSFLASSQTAIRGACLEIGDDRYLRQFGGDRVTGIDVLHFCEGNPKATLVGDLVSLPHVDDAQFDCIICTQTLQFVTDSVAAIKTMVRLLRPGGTLLLTVPGISRLDTDPTSSWNDRWRYTSAGLRTLFEKAGAAKSDTTIEAFGNVFTSAAFLYGLAAEELDSNELEFRDPAFELLVATRFTKS